jgi:tetratricopeptide (TPR) repeat protein
LLDGNNSYCFGQEVCKDLPATNKVMDLLKNARSKSGNWPSQIYISKKDPYVEILKAICSGLNLLMTDLPPKEFKPLVKEFSDSFKQFKQGERQIKNEHLSPADQEELEAFTPDTYGPCTCGSGKKFKFCCKDGFKEIVLAMCAAQDGYLEQALRHMKEAEIKIGTTAEILCRYAICWSFSNRENSTKYLNEALKLNPNHPRTNYILGIESVQDGNFEAAITFYKRAIEHYPKEDKVHLNETYNNLGTVFYKTKNYIEAKAAWENALVLLPKDVMVRNNLIECIYDNPDVPKEIRVISPFILKFIERESRSR